VEREELPARARAVLAVDDHVVRNTWIAQTHADPSAASASLRRRVGQPVAPWAEP